MSHYEVDVYSLVWRDYSPRYVATAASEEELIGVLRREETERSAGGRMRVYALRLMRGEGEERRKAAELVAYGPQDELEGAAGEVWTEWVPSLERALQARLEARRGVSVGGRHGDHHQPDGERGRQDHAHGEA